MFSNWPKGCLELNKLANDQFNAVLDADPVSRPLSVPRNAAVRGIKSSGLTRSLAGHGASLQACERQHQDTRLCFCDSPAAHVCSGKLNFALISSDTHKHPLPAAEEQTDRTGIRFISCNERSKCSKQPGKDNHFSSVRCTASFPLGKPLPETHLDQPKGALCPQPLLGILPEAGLCSHTHRGQQCPGCSQPNLPSPLHPGLRWDGFPQAQADGGSSQSPSGSIRLRGCRLRSAPSSCCFPAPNKHSQLSLCRARLPSGDTHGFHFLNAVIIISWGAGWM